MQSLINKIKLFSFILNHPLTNQHKIRTLFRYLRWQISSRLALGAVAVPYVGATHLLVKPSMTGATGNIYTGLHEFEDMAFVLHCLRKDDLFVDVGANIGSYTVLAGGAVDAKCISIEPLPETFAHLTNNINLNGIYQNVTSLNIGVGECSGVLRFTSDQDTVNHVLSEEEVNKTSFIEVPVHSLNDIISYDDPTVIKIDVEGFETNVIKGADKVLSKKSLLAVLMELNGSGERYGFDEVELHTVMLSYGFQAYSYDPFNRKIIFLNGKNNSSGNTLYLRQVEEIKKRIKNASKYEVKATSNRV